MTPFEELIQRIKSLRDPQTGCPWDIEQTHASLTPYFLEEVHEFLDALERHGPSSAKTWEELGDVLFQVALHAELLSEKGHTDLAQVARRLAEKIVERHPHVFDPTAPRYGSADEVNRAWERLKSQRKAASGAPAPNLFERLDEIPRSLPALQRAARMGEKAASFGFDWPNAEEVRPKILEEFQEWTEAQTQGEEREREELGDLLFAIAQYCRLKKWTPESLLHGASDKFLGRMQGLQSLLDEQGLRWETESLESLEAFYQQAKARKPRGKH
mgnify:CR=1 FL=1